MLNRGSGTYCSSQLSGEQSRNAVGMLLRLPLQCVHLCLQLLQAGLILPGPDHCQALLPVLALSQAPAQNGRSRCELENLRWEAM